MSNQPNNLKDRILGEIRSGELSMRPRAYFMLQVAALVVVALVVLVISVFIFNFILFSIRLNRVDTLLGHGPSGWSAFVRFFPWTLLVIDVASVALLEWLLRQFRFGNKIPVLYLLGGLLLATVAFAAVIDRGTAVNDQLFLHRRELPPPFGSVYGGARHHDADDTLRGFGIPLGPQDFDDASSSEASGTPAE